VDKRQDSGFKRAPGRRQGSADASGCEPGPGVDVTIRCAAHAETSLIRSAPRILQATALTLLAAGAAALALAVLPLSWFVLGVVLCGTLALVAEVVARRRAARTKRDEAARADAARLAKLKQTSETLKARERAVERAQMEVLEGFRQEHEIDRLRQAAVESVNVILRDLGQPELRGIR
jgi:hypothetical protein